MATADLADILPPLPSHCGSWIVLDGTGKAVAEIFQADARIAARLDPLQYVCVSAAEYLGAINGKPSHGFTIAEIAWQLLHMDNPQGRALTIADAVSALASVEA